MSWSFVNSRTVKKTRKPHDCLICDREIPIGKSAFNWNGLYDGEFQNGYACMYCFENKIGRDSGEDEIGGDDFNYWVEEQGFSTCPNCGEVQGFNSYEWDLLKENISFECDCGHDWTVHIGWGESEVTK